MTYFLQMLIVMILIRIWLILNDFKCNRATPLVTTGIFSSFLIVMLRNVEGFSIEYSQGPLTTFELMLYFILISLLVIYVFLSLKMINGLIKREYIPYSPIFWLDIMVVIVSIISYIGLYLTPIVYFMYLTFPVFIYSLLSRIIRVMVKK